MTATPACASYPGTESVDLARFRRPALASALIALGVYVLTLAPDLSWANGAYDGAELITASATLGVSHPPGYPTYILLGKLFSLLPLGSVAFRYNLFSAVCAAAAVGLTVLIIGTLRPRIRLEAAASAALLFGFAPLVWSQAVVAEVYSLNLFMLAAFLLAWSRRGANVSSGFWLGLAITTHLTSALWLPVFLLDGYRQWRRAGIGLALGLSPLLFLPWLGLSESPVIWGQPTHLAGWWWLVSGQLYAANIQPTISVERWLSLLQAMILGPVVSLVVWKASLPPTTDQPAEARLPAINSRPIPYLLVGTSLLYMLFALSYDTPDAAVLLLPVFLVLALLIAPLLQRLGMAALLLPLILVILTFGARDLRGQYSARNLADAVLQTAPANALLLTPGDRTIFTLLYFQQVEGVRPDLRLVDANLFAFDWYRARLAKQYPDLSIPRQDDLPALHHDNEHKRPFCLVSLVSSPEALTSITGIGPEREGGAPYLLCAERTD
ncbi:MAG: DUF2723 domain-containing protein [Anaerolineae bacterium]|nr:DUF2723 domain-containing protein [Anaerolineae bacterium]